MMRILITGGTGLIGRALTKGLIADGHEVIILTRNPDKVTNMPATARLQKWDGETAEGWGELADGADAIVNLAGAGIADGRWSAQRKQQIRQSRLNAGRAVMAAIDAAKVKPRVLVQASAVGYYGTETGDAQVTENESPGNDFLSKVCFDWEMSTAPASRLGVRRPVIRTGVVLSNEGGAFPKLVMPHKFYVGGPVGSGDQWLPWIHIDDEVRAIQFLLADERADGPFNLAAPTPVTNKEMGASIGDTLGRPSFVPAPSFAMRIVFGEMATVLLDGQRAIPHKLQELGFTFKYPTIQAALKDLLPSKPEAEGDAESKRDEPTPAKSAAPTDDSTPESVETVDSGTANT